MTVYFGRPVRYGTWRYRHGIDRTHIRNAKPKPTIQVKVRSKPHRNPATAVRQQWRQLRRAWLTPRPDGPAASNPDARMVRLKKVVPQPTMAP
jgi:hypothetical protein